MFIISEYMQCASCSWFDVSMLIVTSASLNQRETVILLYKSLTVLLGLFVLNLIYKSKDILFISSGLFRLPTNQLKSLSSIFCPFLNSIVYFNDVSPYSYL